MLRFYNHWTGEHLYTTSEDEAANLRTAGWKDEGMAWNSPTKDNKGVEKIYRLYNPYADDHMFTTNPNEVNKNVKDGWKLDERFEAYGYAGSQESAQQAVYRMFNPYEKNHTHLFTTDKQEYDRNIGLGWQGENTMCYVPSLPKTPASTDQQTSIPLVGGLGNSSSSSTSSNSTTTSNPDTSSTSPSDTTSNPDTSSTSPSDTTSNPDTSSTSPSDTTSNPDTSSTSSSTDLADYQKTTLKQLQKSVDTLIREDETNLLNGTTVEKLKETATNAEAKANQKDATAEQKILAQEARYKADWAQALKNYDDIVKAQMDHGTDLGDEYYNAIEAIKAKEAEVFPQTYQVHFANDALGNTGDNCKLKDTAVTVYTCIATQRYAVPSALADFSKNTNGDSFAYTEASAVLQQLSTLMGPNPQGVDKNFGDCSFITQDGRHARVRAKKDASGKKLYVIDFIKPNRTSNSKQETTPADKDAKPLTLAKDEYNTSGLDELNLSFLGDTSTSHSTAEDMSSFNLKRESEDLTYQLERTQAQRKGLNSYRTYLIANEFAVTEGNSLAAKQYADDAYKTFVKNASEHRNPMTHQLEPLTEQAIHKLQLQISIVQLKLAEIAYKGEKTTDNRVKAISAEIEVINAFRATLPENDPKLEGLDKRSAALIELSGILQKESESDNTDTFNAYVAAFIAWMNDPSDANKNTRDAAKAKFEGKEEARPATPKNDAKTTGGQQSGNQKGPKEVKPAGTTAKQK